MTDSAAIAAFDAARLRRVVVVGTSGAGKTTLARALADGLGIPHVQLDALHWGPNWTERPDDEFRADVSAAVAAPAWVVDGNYTMVRELVWPRALCIVWLDYSFRVVFGRAVARTFSRMVTREPLYAGNTESLRIALSWDGIPMWVLRTYHRRRREYRALFAQPENQHFAVIRLTAPGQYDAFVERAVAARDGADPA